jgi:hypothetical protein
MTTLNVLKNVRFVIDSEGKESAVQVNIKDWKALLEYLESMEDRAMIKAMLARLIKGPQKAGALDWREVEDQW